MRRFAFIIATALSARRWRPLLAMIKASNHDDWPDRVDVIWWRTAIAFALGDTS